MDNHDITVIQVNKNLQLHLGYVGGVGGSTGPQSDPIYSKDKPNLALKSELFSKDYNDLKNKPEIPTKTSQLTNDSGFITDIPQNLVTEQELNNKGYLTSYTESDPIYTQDKPNIALKSELFSKSYNDLTDKPDLYTPKTDGDGSKFLADNGQYKTVQTGTDIDLSDYTGAVKLKLEDGTTFFQRNANVNQLRIGNFNTDGTGYNLSSTDIFSNYIQAHAKQFKIQVNNNGELNNTLDVQDGYIQIGVSQNKSIDLYGNYLKWYQQQNSDYPLYGVDFSSATEFKLPENTTINGNKIGGSGGNLKDVSVAYRLDKNSQQYEANFNYNAVILVYDWYNYCIQDGVLKLRIVDETNYSQEIAPTIEVMIPYRNTNITTFEFNTDYNLQSINIPEEIVSDSNYSTNFAVFTVRKMGFNGSQYYQINYAYSFGINS